MTQAWNVVVCEPQREGRLAAALKDVGINAERDAATLYEAAKALESHPTPTKGERPKAAA